jgi:type IV secretory pathway VirB2 component (pilin)
MGQGVYFNATHYIAHATRTGLKFNFPADVSKMKIGGLMPLENSLRKAQQTIATRIGVRVVVLLVIVVGVVWWSLDPRTRFDLFVFALPVVVPAGIALALGAVILWITFSRHAFLWTAGIVFALCFALLMVARQYVPLVPSQHENWSDLYQYYSH